ncbi:hypothetical protein J1N35_038295 [Gossypium stocksii]|uniref:Uncharacterized protein n=1 Tax=Gossypium stocksii TaxID=47602 RepID=A0A9D3ULQ7_9ROSI|nr:hypothetical protein J1N35_038295 [Gossypium stocksii]
MPVRMTQEQVPTPSSPGDNEVVSIISGDPKMINDFSTYANLSGWIIKGRIACPICAENTQSRWLQYGRKFYYMGHRQWLSTKHPFRK